MEEEYYEIDSRELNRVMLHLHWCNDTRTKYAVIIGNTILNLEGLRGGIGEKPTDSEISLRIVEELASCYQKLSKVPFFKRSRKKTELKRKVSESALNTIRAILNQVYDIGENKLEEDQGTSDALVDLLEAKVENQPISFRVISTHIRDLEHSTCALKERSYDSNRELLVKSSVGWEFSSAAFMGRGMVGGSPVARNALDETNKSINVKFKANKNNMFWTIEAPPPVGKKSTVDAIDVYEIVCNKKPTGVILFSQDQVNVFIQTALNDPGFKETITERVESMKPIGRCHKNIEAIKDTFKAGLYKSRWVKTNESFQTDVEGKFDKYLKDTVGEADTKKVGEALKELIEGIDDAFKSNNIHKGSYYHLTEALKLTQARFNRGAKAQEKKPEVVQEKRKSFSK